MSDIPPAATAPKPKTLPQERVEKLPPYHVVLLDDQDHTYEYVIKMMQTVFGYDLERSFTIARTVDAQGRVVCLTTHKEHAELKRDQILSYGRDRLIKSCRGSMGAIIEPADYKPDDGGREGT